MLRIDAHHHFWKVARGDYHWMPDSGILRCDWLPEQLDSLTRAAGISATVLVQAAQTEAETAFLLDLADQPNSQVVGVVGWVDLERNDAMDRLDRFAEHPKAVAVRPMLQNLDDPAWILRPSVRNALGHLARLGLTFEVLSYPGHLPYAHKALAALPDLRVVIDHLSKPSYDPRNDQHWREWMTIFAQRDNTAVKVSGMVTEVVQPWTINSFKANVEFVMEAFGPKRLMFGSDWPVCLQAAGHAEVVELAAGLTEQLSDSEREAFWATTAQELYRLGHRA